MENQGKKDKKESTGGSVSQTSHTGQGVMEATILDRNEKVLRQIAKEVPREHIQSPEIRDIISKMKHALAAEDDGVGLAAPQIGVSYRIFIIAPRVYKIEKNEVSGKIIEITDKERKEKIDATDKQTVFINPEFIKLSKEKEEMEEGCLSVRPLYGQVKRSKKVVMRAYNELSQQVEIGASSLLAQIFQHEVDHLNGVLFIDKAKNVGILEYGK